MNILKFAERFPTQVHPKLVDQLHKDTFSKIHSTVDFNEEVAVGDVHRIGAYTSFKDGVVIGNKLRIGKFVIVGCGTVLEDGVFVGSHTDIGSWNLFCEGSRIPEKRKPDSSVQYNIRQTKDGCIIGPNVMLPSEFQLGEGAIVPTNQTIRQVGRFGLSRRMVTIYGSQDGPVYSVGCQFGVTLEHFQERAEESIDTVPESSSDYLPHFETFKKIGEEVQNAYVREFGLIDELKGRYLAMVGISHDIPSRLDLDDFVY